MVDEYVDLFSQPLLITCTPTASRTIRCIFIEGIRFLEHSLDEFYVQAMLSSGVCAQRKMLRKWPYYVGRKKLGGKGLGYHAS